MNEDNMGPIRLKPLIEEYQRVIDSEQLLAETEEEQSKELFERVDKAWERILALGQLAEIATPTPEAGMSLPKLIATPLTPIGKNPASVPSDWNHSRIQSLGDNHGSIALRLAVEYGRLASGDIQAYNKAKKTISDHLHKAQGYEGKIVAIRQVFPLIEATFQDDEVV